ncbi:MAG: F0F1 ATP synthase subunit gamma [Candidatus Atribacteria bacterium]|nr:F0F1 ATP synthase subunit gamma [Candidatus Atribacteria bacterium]MCD6349665.1 F0F1 ATP synthase subunit gamma [Candidatus Atribacteria bacterium]
MTRLSDIRRKIDLVKDIEHLTRTMKTISAIRWRMSRNLLQPAVDFRLKLELALELTALHLKNSSLSGKNWLFWEFSQIEAWWVDLIKALQNTCSNSPRRYKAHQKRFAS